MKVKFNKTEISEISQKLLDKILKMDNKKARVVALSGNLGAGKTTLTQEFGRQLGIKENIISPTFVIMKIYKISPGSKYYSNFKQLIHIDAYRLESSVELLKIGWKELKSDKDNLIIIEWPENVKKALSGYEYSVKLEHEDDQTRVIEF
jgi:tRNA threonylcarbamoyladenosine biosynthesis protein TsaE